jgi:hypothetical protein
MTPVAVTSWLAVLQQLIALGASLKDIIVLVRQTLGADDTEAVLAALLDGWHAAKAENEARIKELEKQIAEG